MTTYVNVVSNIPAKSVTNVRPIQPLIRSRITPIFLNFSDGKGRLEKTGGLQRKHFSYVSQQNHNSVSFIAYLCCPGCPNFCLLLIFY